MVEAWGVNLGPTSVDAGCPWDRGEQAEGLHPGTGIVNQSNNVSGKEKRGGG